MRLCFIINHNCCNCYIVGSKACRASQKAAVFYHNKTEVDDDKDVELCLCSKEKKGGGADLHVRGLLCLLQCFTTYLLYTENSIGGYTKAHAMYCHSGFFNKGPLEWIILLGGGLLCLYGC